MKIGMACDHGAYTYKEEIKQMLIDEGHEVVDCGCHGTNSVDYPDMAKACADLVVNEEVDKGIVFCGGVGIFLLVLKIKKEYWGVFCGDMYVGLVGRENKMMEIFGYGGKKTKGVETCKDIVHTFLNTPFSEGERHKGRVAKISAIEDAQ